MKKPGLNLDMINESLQDRAREAFAAGDLTGLFCCADSSNYILLFLRNAPIFLACGLYEKALLMAWSGQKWTLGVSSDGSLFRWDVFMPGFLLSADRARLTAASDPLPAGDVLTIYRGVGGQGVRRATRGIAWTLSLQVAEMFAGYGLNNERPALYKTTVSRSDVFAYINESGRSEQEVLVTLDKKHPLERLPVKRGKPMNFKELAELHGQLLASGSRGGNLPKQVTSIYPSGRREFLGRHPELELKAELHG